MFRKRKISPMDRGFLVLVDGIYEVIPSLRRLIGWFLSSAHEAPRNFAFNSHGHGMPNGLVSDI